jgi:hypothetical protein
VIEISPPPTEAEDHVRAVPGTACFVVLPRADRTAAATGASLVTDPANGAEAPPTARDATAKQVAPSRERGPVPPAAPPHSNQLPI